MSGTNQKNQKEKEGQKMTVKEILDEWLPEHGYDGLYNQNCCNGCRVGSLCKVGDILNCSVNVRDCKPGYLHQAEKHFRGWYIDSTKPDQGDK